MKGLRGLRYCPDPKGPKGWLIDSVANIQNVGLDAALGFYQLISDAGAQARRRKRGPGHVIGYSDYAFLGCNDRFFLLSRLCRRLDMEHPWLYDRCREVEADPWNHVDLWARYHYKMVQINEPVPTPDGWKKHGDLVVGDRVFGPDGKPTQIVARTQVWTDGDCFRVTFDKGYSVVVGGDHLWTVDLHSRARVSGNRREGRRRVTIDTRSLMLELEKSNVAKTRVLPSVAVCSPLEYQPADLPIDPYVLGAWLGDGTSCNGDLTCGDAEVFDRINANYDLGRDRTPHRSAASRKIEGLSAQLKSLGLKNNKHIPALFLRSSVEQRIALLQGLMDTDGHCDVRGTATFVNIKDRLAEDVFDLAAGLGLKPSLRRHVGCHNGEPYPYWHVSFQARGDSFAVFAISRKQDRATVGDCRRSGRHAIVSVEPVESVPCSCVQVDRPDGLYLIGRHYVPTHNSTIITFGGALQEIVCDPEVKIAIFSVTKPIAQAFLKQIKEEAERNELLQKVYPDVLWEKPKVEAPVWGIARGLIFRRKSNPKESTVEAHGLVDGQPTSRHYDKHFYDDLVTRESVTTPEQIKKTTEAWELADNLGGHEGVDKAIAGTHYHFADTYMVIRNEKRGGIKERIYPATDDGSINGKPVFLTPDRWAKVRSTQKSTISAQMLLNPVAGAEQMFRLEWARPYEVRPSVLNVYIMGDPSKGRSKSSDRTAIAVIGIDPNNNKYLLDGVCHRMPQTQRWAFLKALYKKWLAMPGVQTVNVGWETYGMQTDDEYFRERMRHEDDCPVFDIRELSWTRDGLQSKPDRVERLEPEFRESRFFLPGLVFNADMTDPRDGYRHPQGLCTWKIGPSSDPKNKALVVAYTPFREPSKAMRAVDVLGQPYRKAEAIKRVEQLGEGENRTTTIYDVTRVMLEEMRDFPFSPRDDFVDAASRLFDMEPVTPSLFEEIAAEPKVYSD